MSRSTAFHLIKPVLGVCPQADPATRDQRAAGDLEELMIKQIVLFFLVRDREVEKDHPERVLDEQGVDPSDIGLDEADVIEIHRMSIFHRPVERFDRNLNPKKIYPRLPPGQRV